MTRQRLPRHRRSPNQLTLDALLTHRDVIDVRWTQTRRLLLVMQGGRRDPEPVVAALRRVRAA